MVRRSTAQAKQAAPLTAHPPHFPTHTHAGEGEIIGVGDSGLDTGHCFFEESQGGTATNQNYSPDHRKVVAYRAYADGGATGTRDHGTHVVGSILGKSSAPGAQGAGERGSAYEAKVSFTDIGPGDAPGLAVPNDLVNNFFNVDYANGARIHSNSWGANINAYTNPTQDVDEFMALNDDMLILFAAGNSGQDGPGTYTSQQQGSKKQHTLTTPPLTTHHSPLTTHRPSPCQAPSAHQRPARTA